ncbi:MAG: GntR family transcriptional regulator [Clostridia bacterium]|nr:GntR family transcriptional regulator [Clostridia bacterium]
MIRLDYKNDKPLHEQITQGIKDLIICGVLASGDQLPSVRELSVDLTVNPNTVQRAYKTLETEGVIYSIRGKGNFVAESHQADNRTLDKLYFSLAEIVRELAFYGESEEKILKITSNILKERNDDK